jgi:predicted DNA-binding transcriptional regulator AlpA
MGPRPSFDTELKGGAMRTDERKRIIPSEGFMRLPEVLYVFPVSRSTWWAGINAGRFPKGVKLGPRITAWKVEDIRKLIERRN